jgi:3-methyladenine DNA glycosylase AlkD
MLIELEKRLKEKENKEKAKILQRFFKTGKGEYGEGDIFLGIVVPEQRKIAKEFKDLELKDLKELLDSKIHEKRLIALLILIEKYKISDDKNKIFDFYMSNTQKINNWDLVDLSSPQIIGDFLLDKDRKILHKLAISDNLWERRIGIISTLSFIRNNEYLDTLNIAKILLKDKHDLIQKAVGWMLREVGKKDEQELENFLKIHYKEMPRTMLRYAIERFNEDKRKKYLKGEV